MTLNVNCTALKKNLRSTSLGCEEPGVCVIRDRVKELFQDNESVNGREPGSQSSTRSLFPEA